MGDFGNFLWKYTTSTSSNHDYSPNPLKAYDAILQISQEKSYAVRLSDECKTIDRERNQFKESYRKFIDSISNMPFIAFFNIWIREGGYLRDDILESAKLLLENDFIDFYSEGATFTIEKSRNFDHQTVIDLIRCKQQWSILRKETLVRTYLDFMHWLWGETLGYINRLVDPDWLRTQKRKLAFPRFLDFLGALYSEKSQLVAKLLYFGRDRNLENILNIKIEHIDLQKHRIFFDTLDDIPPLGDTYPIHVFSDIKTLIGNRKEGFLFLGRQDAPLNDATIFRHFNEAAEKVGLGESFGPKKLITNKLD